MSKDSKIAREFERMWNEDGWKDAMEGFAELTGMTLDQALLFKIARDIQGWAQGAHEQAERMRELLPKMERVLDEASEDGEPWRDGES